MLEQPVRPAPSPEPPPDPGAAQPTPPRARLLWRGELLLSDGSALPGVCFVSRRTPVFAAAGVSPEQELCLALEMLRHRPLVLRAAATVLAPPQQQQRVAFSGSGDVRMYIDPRCLSTLAWFERHWCQEQSESAGDGSRIFELSLDTLHDVSSAPAQADVPVSVAEEGQREASQADDPFSAAYKPSTARASSALPGGLQLAICARPGADSEAGKVEMIVGRTVVRRPERLERPPSRPGDPAPRSALSAMLAGRSRNGAGRQDSASLLPTVPQPRRASTASGAIPAGGSAAKAAPAPPRALSKTAMLRKSASTPNVMGLASVKEEERPSGPASPPPPSRAETSASPSKRGGNHTPGRRGEKRARPSSAASGSGGMQQARIKRERSASIFSPATESFDLPAVSGASSDAPDGKAVNAVEQRNKAAVKKLVHHQLLGRGYERRDEAYIACFNVTCAGTTTALRDHIHLRPIDRAHAANLVAAHLAMYLAPPAAPPMPAMPRPPAAPLAAAADMSDMSFTSEAFEATASPQSD